MRKFTTTLLLLLFCAIGAMAQTRTISGTVKDDNGDPVPFATITEMGTNNATLASENGEFTMKFKAGARLEFSAVGYSSKIITPGAAVRYDVVLEKTDNQLQEVVVSTALGLRKQPRELGYSVASVNRVC